MQPIRVAHIIPDLGLGGAETALVRLLEGLDRARVASLVVTLRDGGALVERARDAGARVVSLGMRTRLPSAWTIARLRRALRAFAPDVVQGWMYHGNVAAWLGARLVTPRPTLAWNVRQSLATVRHERHSTRLALRANVLLSPSVDCVVNNSQASAAQHAALGLAPRASAVIPNGFDTVRFAPSAEVRHALRATLGLAPDVLLAGMMARVAPVKRHDLFLDAIAAARRSGIDVHAVLAGTGAEPGNGSLAGAIAARGLAGSVHLLGERRDVERVLPALDVLVSASGWAEGFPNAVGEAMACAVPCLVTDTGDCAAIVGDGGVVVPPRDGARLAAALAELLRLPADERARIGARGRLRVRTEFSMERCLTSYARLYDELASNRRGALASRARDMTARRPGSP